MNVPDRSGRLFEFVRSCNWVVSGLVVAACLCPAGALAEGAAIGSNRSSAAMSDSELVTFVDALRHGTITLKQLKAMPGQRSGDALSYFADRNEADMVNRVIGLGVPPDQPNSFGTNALVVAIGDDSLAAAAALIAAGADPQATTSRGTPAEYARRVGSIEMKALLLNGKIPDAADQLRSAARNGELGVVRSLVASGADPGSADANGVTPILEAAQAGDLEAVRLLLKLGAGPDGSPTAGITPLAVAVVSGNTELVRTLLEANANSNAKARGVPILSLAVIAGKKEVIDLLLAAKADAAISGSDGTKPADIAAAIGQPDLAVRLGGSRVFTPSTDLFAAIKARDGGKLEAALHAGADPNQKNAEGYPALVYAAAFGDKSSVELLMQAGADPFAVGPGRVSALHAAYARSDGVSDTIAEALINDRQSASVFQLLSAKDSSGRSVAVVMAAHAKSKSSDPFSTAVNPLLYALQYLIDRALVASLANSPDADGMTPLEAAVLTDNDAVVKGFVEAGVTPMAAKGGTSLQELARARGAWRALAALPSDRVMPDGLKKGAAASAKTEFQALLSLWGYYKGNLDGAFGKTANAAAVAFFRDRGEEIRRMVDALGATAQFEHPKEKPGSIKLSIRFHGPSDSCTWILNEWYPSGRDSSVSMVGCFRGGEKSNSIGIGYVIYGNGSDVILLFGENGWKDATQLR